MNKQMINWINTHCRFASATVSECAAKAIEAAFAKAFLKVAAGQKKITTAQKTDLIDVAVDYIQTDPELAPAWQNLVARAKALKAGGELAQPDIVNLLQPVNATIGNVARIYNINPEDIKKKLLSSLGLSDVVPAVEQPRATPRKPQVSFEEWRALRGK